MIGVVADDADDDDDDDVDDVVLLEMWNGVMGTEQGWGRGLGCVGGSKGVGDRCGQ